MAHYTLIARINAGNGKFPFVNVKFSKNHRPIPIEGATYYLRPSNGCKRTPIRIGKDLAVAHTAFIGMDYGQPFEAPTTELRFKGGTSLSKVFGLIDRLSEDIDISIDRAALGFSGERDLANPALSVTKRKALDQELSAAITNEVKSRILPKLHDRFKAILGGDGWTLTPSDQENDEKTLHFHYPNAFAYSKYL